MPLRLSPQTIEALAEIISGGRGSSFLTPAATPSIGKYRSGPELEKFMRSCKVQFTVIGSRVPSLVSCLIDVNDGERSEENLTRIIEGAADPRDYLTEPERHTAVVNYLNTFLRYDGYELREVSGRLKLFAVGQSSAIITNFAAKVSVIDFDTVQRDLERALASADNDPEDAVTSACSTVESVCRSVLGELDIPLPAKKDIAGLYRAIREPLGLAVERQDFSSQIADDIRKVLSGLVTTVEGIGSLRTHAGDAHGREKGYRRIDARIARLSIHAASTVSLFIIETWQRKYPSKPLKKH